MIKGVDANVASATVNGPWWPVEATGVAPLELDWLLAYGYIFGDIRYRLTRHDRRNFCN